ncbi:MAG: glycosyltransferase [Anaerolineae bacterium]|nr:glycosyltransferase [Anaerolineae bacterium]
MKYTPEELTFCILSFEGPDRYALAGGLGVRVSHLARTLARAGSETHLLFVGDPAAPGREEQMDGNLILHRWCQWISAHHSGGVYAAEEAKLWDFSQSAPSFIVDEIVRPALAAGRLPVILAEEWHTAEAVSRLHERLLAEGLRDRCVLLWNANNTMSFHRLDWPRLNEAAQLTTVSRYMKHLMWPMGLDPLVIPNGIPAELLETVAPAAVEALCKTLRFDDDTVLLFKVGRFDPAKRWLMAVEAAARLKEAGHRVVFPLRGGVEAHGAEVLDYARARGLSVVDVDGNPATPADVISLLQAAPPGDIYNLRFFMTQEMLRLFYRAADAVLANSGHEPFGLVGLEAMAAGGLVFTGITGEEYSFYNQGTIALDTNAPAEIVTQILSLKTDGARGRQMRRQAHKRAAAYTWERILEVLMDKIQFVAETTGVQEPRHSKNGSQPRRQVQDVLIYTVIHQPRRLRLPAERLPPDASPGQLEASLFDEPLNEQYFRQVARSCYYPALDRLEPLLDEGLKLAIGFSLSFVEQAQRWDEALLDRFVELVQHPHVELVAVEPFHSFLLLWDVPRFMARMRETADRLQAIFGQRPRVADTTELMMSDTIYHALELAGFEAAFMDGRPWVLDWRQPTHLYHHNGGQMKLFTRHYQLSDDVGYRFSDRGWNGWPLMADRYASWIADSSGDLVVLGWDFETFGEHHREESGIFDFLAALPREVQNAGLSFVTPGEALTRHTGSHDLPLPAFASTWAGSGGLEFFLGNDAQSAVFQLMVQAYNKALLTGNPALIELALWLAQSDNLHLIQWYGRSGTEAEVSAYFTPQEWWVLGNDGIIWEIQQVYKNFIAALDAYLPRQRRADERPQPKKLVVEQNLALSVSAD